MTTTTEVTQAPSPEAMRFCVQISPRVEGCLLPAIATIYDQHRAQALAQGRLEGVEAGLAAAADICDHRCDDGEDDACCEDTAFCIGYDIRNLSAQTIAIQIGEK